MDDREARIARNEALFREVNEQIDTLNDAGAQAASIPVVCECGSNRCAEAIKISPAAYEAVRVHGDRFLIKSGHQFDDVETVVEEYADYAVVAKKPGEPRRIAEDTDPRK
jgi:5-bromo-4-chloroindolyl phosphate hydrolysis protein